MYVGGFSIRGRLLPLDVSEGACASLEDVVDLRSLVDVQSSLGPSYARRRVTRAVLGNSTALNNLGAVGIASDPASVQQVVLSGLVYARRRWMQGRLTIS